MADLPEKPETPAGSGAPVKNDSSHNSTVPLNEDTEKQANDNSKTESTYVTGTKLWVMTAGITLVFFLMLLDISILSTATPRITSDFHSLANVGWYGAAYQLSSATLQPLTGKIYTNFSSKWTFFGFFLVFEFGSVLCGAAVSSNMLIIGRAVAGMGSSGLINGGLTIFSNASPLEKRAMGLGIAMGISQLGLVAAPLIGGVLTQHASWRWCFWINLPIGGLVAAFLIFIHVPEPVQKPPIREVLPKLHKQLDLIGFALFAPASILLLLAVQWGGNQYAWDSGVLIGLFCAFGVMLLLWIAWSYYKKDDAMIPFPLLRKRRVWTSCLLGGTIQPAIYANSYYLPIYFQGVRGKSPTMSGVFLLPSILSQLTAAVMAGRIIGKFGYYLPLGTATGMLTAVGYGLLTTLAVNTSTGKWVGYQLIAGFGRGLGFTVPLLAVQNNLPPAKIPVAMAVLIATQNYSGALFLSFGDVIFTNSLRDLVNQTVQGVNGNELAHAGAYAFRQIVPKADLPAVLRAYATSIDRVFYMNVGLSVAAFFSSFGTGWADIRKKPEKSAPSTDENNQDAPSVGKAS